VVWNYDFQLLLKKKVDNFINKVHKETTVVYCNHNGKSISQNRSSRVKKFKTS